MPTSGKSVEISCAPLASAASSIPGVARRDGGKRHVRARADQEAVAHQLLDLRRVGVTRLVALDERGVLVAGARVREDHAALQARAPLDVSVPEGARIVGTTPPADRASTWRAPF